MVKGFINCKKDLNSGIEIEHRYRKMPENTHCYYLISYHQRTGTCYMHSVHAVRSHMASEWNNGQRDRQLLARRYDGEYRESLRPRISDSDESQRYSRWRRKLRHQCNLLQWRRSAVQCGRSDDCIWWEKLCKTCYLCAHRMSVTFKTISNVG